MRSTAKVAANVRRVAVSLGIASLAAGCVQPVYQAPGPIPLLDYPPPVPYRSIPDYRDSGPVLLQPVPPPVAPVVEPLPPPTPAPADTVSPASSEDLGGSIPVQDMPAPATSAAPSPNTPGTDPGAPAAPAAQTIRKIPTSGAGANVPLEGFRPMHSQTRPAP